jgi:hypothetical protein
MRAFTLLGYIILGCLGVGGCYSEAVGEKSLENQHFIKGKLTEQHVVDLELNVDNIESVAIDSPGGSVSAGRRIGKLLYEYDLPLYVINECSSSCAEYVMPGAAYVVADSNAIFSFHGSTYIRRDLALQKGFEIDERCPWQALEWLDFIYAEKNLSYSFIEMQKKAIGFPRAELLQTQDGCLLFKSYKPTRTVWRPSIDTMRDVWGLDIREIDVH